MNSVCITDILSLYFVDAFGNLAYSFYTNE